MATAGLALMLVVKAVALLALFVIMLRILERAGEWVGEQLAATVGALCRVADQVIAIVGACLKILLGVAILMLGAFLVFVLAQTLSPGASIRTAPRFAPQSLPRDCESTARQLHAGTPRASDSASLPELSDARR